ncbi:MAG: alpha/beta hydrolase [Bacteroidales bacterium]|nr:alpha/beta hydrolase [Bacteroidales bacterium]
MKSTLIAAIILTGTTAFGQQLQFDADNYTNKEIQLSGKTIKYKAYEKIYYVGNVEDSAYQYMNIYVPENADGNSPIILKNYVTNYRSATAKQPNTSDITGKALGEGMVVCIAGARGSNAFSVKNVVQKKKKKSTLVDQEVIYTGKLPAPLLDLKAAVRYLKANDSQIPGNSQKIISCGSSAGGAISALLGTTANHPDYEPAISCMKAAKANDDIYASICYSPYFIQFKEDGTVDYWEEFAADKEIRNQMLKSAQKAMASGSNIPDSLGPVFFADTFISDDEQDYLVDFDTQKYARQIMKSTSGKKQIPIDSLPEIKGGLADSISISLREKMSRPFQYINDPTAIKAQNWYIHQVSLDSNANIHITNHLANELKSNGLNVDMRILWSRNRQESDDVGNAMEWIKKINN